MTTAPLPPDCLNIDCNKVVEQSSRAIRKLLSSFHRRGLVLGLSGGIDSSVTAALAVQAVGRDRVFGIHMPDRDSSADTLQLSQSVSACLGIHSVVENITPVLEAVGCYSRQEEAVRLILPEYGPGWKCKIVLESSIERRGFNYFQIVAQSPEGGIVKKRLSSEAYLGMVAATNFKQRIRKVMEYYHADRLNFAVAGTPNRLEYDQGFFVKLGDGAADIKPIAHLYKTQVYQLAEHLGLPSAVRQRPPTTDTYSLPQGQDEFYFTLPYHQMDLCLFAKNHGIAPKAVAELTGLNTEHILGVFRDIDAKRSATRYLHLPPQLIGRVEEISIHSAGSGT